MGSQDARVRAPPTPSPRDSRPPTRQLGTSIVGSTVATLVLLAIAAWLVGAYGSAHRVDREVFAFGFVVMMAFGALAWRLAPKSPSEAQTSRQAVRTAHAQQASPRAVAVTAVAIGLVTGHRRAVARWAAEHPDATADA
jgi:uncharacterized membrane protein